MRILIYGAVMNGKTTFASQFPDAKIISTDGNAEYTFKEENIFKVTNYTELNAALTKLKANPPKWVIVDTMTYLMDYLRYYWLDKNKIAHESDLPYKGYGMLRAFLWESIVNIANMFENIIFIAHEAQVVTKNKFGREVTTFSPEFDDKLKDRLMGIMAICGRALKDVNEQGLPSYRLHIGHTDDEFGGSRVPIHSTNIELTKGAFDNNFVKPA